MTNTKLAQMLIEETCAYWEDLEFSPLDGKQYELGTIVVTLLRYWNVTSVLVWLMQVYQSYL